MSATREAGHETRDVRLRPVIIGTALITLMTLVAAAGMVALYGALADREAERSRPRNPLASTVSQVPPEPRLQALPIADLQTLREAEDRRLGSYAWVDREAGVARIPIERAIDLLLEKSGEAEQ